MTTLFGRAPLLEEMIVERERLKWDALTTAQRELIQRHKMALKKSIHFREEWATANATDDDELSRLWAILNREQAEIDKILNGSCEGTTNKGDI